VMLRYTLPYSDIAKLTFAIYDLRGRRVWRLDLHNIHRPGLSWVSWDGRDGDGRSVAAGVYILKMTALEKGSSKPATFKFRLTRLP